MNRQFVEAFMKALAINGSPKRQGNTRYLIEIVLNELQAEGIDTEVYQLGGKLVQGCTACMQCLQKKNRRCAIETDCINEIIEKALEADAILIGSPTYFSMVTTETKALIDRLGFVAKANDAMLTRKVGAGVVAVRRAGAIPTFDTINRLFFISGMIVPGSQYWNIGIGRMPGEVANDEEGVQIMKTLGQNIAWLMKKLG
jgi:multimeric flavodoxin WrbA